MPPALRLAWLPPAESAGRAKSGKSRVTLGNEHPVGAGARVTADMIGILIGMVVAWQHAELVVMVPRRGRGRRLADVLGRLMHPAIAADGCRLPLGPGLTPLDGCASVGTPCLPSGRDAAAAERGS
jgi:hypothetical protein